MTSLFCSHLYYCDFTSIIKLIDIKNSETISFLTRINELTDQLPKGNSLSFKTTLNKNIISKEYYNNMILNKDLLIKILNQNIFDLNSIKQLVFLIDKKLNTLNIGQQFSLVSKKDGELQHLILKIPCQNICIYDRGGNVVRTNNIQEKGDWVNCVIRGTFSGNFVLSARNAGLTNNEIGAVIKAIQRQSDLRQLKKGDQFSVLISREMLDRKYGQSQLVGVHLHSGGKDYYTIRARDGNFYDLNGISLAKGFLRFPTKKQFRVSSKFNLRRLNPITGRISPHRGVDFAMPQGTPVLAVGDGEVVVVRHTGAAGFYITVRHGRTYMTRYMHLFKLLVKPGQKVKRGDRIALSGNTGRSTGPHLHYEIWINQQAVNPLTATLPRTEELTGKERCNYLAQIKEVIPLF